MNAPGTAGPRAAGAGIQVDAAACGAAADIAIVGGGMVGACLALALRGGPHRVVLLEAARPQGEAGTHASFDDRTTALGNGARRVLETLGLWHAIAAKAAPIHRIHVSEGGRFGFARLDAQQQGLEAFGYSVGNRHIGAVAWEALTAAADAAAADASAGRGAAVPGVTAVAGAGKHVAGDDAGGAIATGGADAAVAGGTGHATRGAGRIEVLAPARVTDVQVGTDQVTLTWTDASNAANVLSARLVVAADGVQSLVKQAAGIGSESSSYEQVAVIANLRSDRPADGVAYERFTDTGPMALLPLFDGGYTAVWTLAPDAAAQAMQYDDATFCARLQQRFGWRAGRFIAAGRRAAYPLALTRAQVPAATRTVVVGNAAQMLHPVAAQGFNLGLRDAALLAELLMDAPDPGDAALLAQFGRRRAADRDGMVRFTDTLVKLFNNPRPGARLLRDLGLLLFDVTPPAKRALSRLSWGFGTGLPKLVRGLPLR